MLVTFEIAKKLDDLNIRIPSYPKYIGYTKGGTLVTVKEYNSEYSEYQKVPYYISAPSIHEAIEWIREKYNIACGVHPFARHSQSEDFICWDYTYMAFDGEKDLLDNYVSWIGLIYSTYEKAELALLEELIKYVEK